MIQYRYQIYSGSLMKFFSQWFDDLYSTEYGVYTYLATNPLSTHDTLYLVSSKENPHKNGIYLETPYRVVKIIYGTQYKNSANCHKLFQCDFENTMLFSEDEIVYKKARWVSENRHLFKSFQPSQITKFQPNDFICKEFHYKALLYLGVDPEQIPWEQIEEHVDLRHWVNDNSGYDESWLSKYRENMLDLKSLAMDLNMLPCKYNNLMNYFKIADLFDQ
jgi:hypothetical protein